MKKIILLVIASLFLSSFLYSQVKVNFSLTNGVMDTVGIFKFDLVATVPAGQLWRVGSSNIRIDFYTVPALQLTVRPDNSTNGGVRGVNTNLNNNANYDWMTTTSINGGTAISLNIVLKSGATTYRMNPGTYTIGRVRWNVIGWNCTYDTIRHSGTGLSVVYDSLTLLTNAQWGVVNPPPCTLVELKEISGNIPTEYKLYENYPNPFNPSTTIKFDLPRESLVKITIYDIIGREVEVLVNESKEPGRYEILWDASKYSSGAYMYKIEAKDFTDVKKMILVK